MKTFNWIYNPGIMDLCSPNVIIGQAIAAQSHVRIAREKFPLMLPTKRIVFIEDKQGNVQSVWRAALERR
jgi:hypothetical protein